MAKASRSSIQGALGRGEGFVIGTGGHPSIKPDRVPAETTLKPAAAQSKELLGTGRALGSGQGAIGQFWNPIKPDRGPAEIPSNHCRTKRSSCVRQFWKPQSSQRQCLRAGQGASASFEPQSKTEAMAKAPEGFEGGAMHPSVLEAQSKSEAVVQLTVALKESDVPHLRWSQAPPCLGQGEAGSADIYYNSF